MNRRVLIFAVTILGLLVTSCHSSFNGVTTVSRTTKNVVAKPKKVISSVKPASNVSDPTKKLLNEANGWLGTPYKYGGNSKSGVDCSGMVCMVFSNALSIKLPRTSSQQGEWCTKIKKSDLQPGDLLFFATTTGSKKISHVGMYIGDGNMIHASTSKGVVVSSLSESYFVKTYHSCGRVAQYYAMVSANKSSSKSAPKPKTDVKKPAPEVKKPIPDVRKPLPEVKKPTPKLDRKPTTKTGVLIAGNKRLPVSKPEVKRVVKDVVKDAVDKSSAKLVAATPGAATRAALEVQRRKVINEVVEQKVDSILSDFFD